MQKFKYFVFRHQWWLLLVVTICTTVALALTSQAMSTYLAVLAVIGSVFYFLQRQNLEEMTLFRDLFKEFNARYDEMNGPLSDILSGADRPLGQDDQKRLIDYFNLCGEEYFYYSRGFIDPRVWNAWHKGMLQYLKNPRIRELWISESKSESYYGLQI